MFREQFFDVAGKSLNAAVGPANGPPLILLHGVTRRWQTFVPVFPALMSRFELFAIDFLGHGRSDRTTRGYRVMDYVESMTALLTAPPFSNQKQIYLYGHSLGSMVAAALAGRLGQRVRAVILEDPPFDTMGKRLNATGLLSYFETLKAFAGIDEPIGPLSRKLADVETFDLLIGRVARLGDVRDAASLRFTAKSLSQLDPRVLDPILSGDWLDGYDTERILAGIRCPALLLQADPTAGGMLTDDDAQHLLQLVPDASRIRINSAGHLIHWQKTETLLRYVQAFFESL